jgi:putative ABC transport system permease protein
MLLAMLLVPAINMAGMVASSMEERLPEFGIRKVFGASRRRLMGQILMENLLLTLIGGAVGLILSYLLMYFGSNWVLTLFNQVGILAPAGAVTFYTVDMLFNPFVFAVTLLLCLLLNYISAAIPAHHALRKVIVYSLNKKR